jgi:hypothetical protein
MALGNTFQVTKQEVIDALPLATLVDFDPTYGFFAQTTHFEYTPPSRVRLRETGYKISRPT